MSSVRGTGWPSTVVVGCITGIALTVDRLPARVAAHFAANGIADAYLSRDAYVAIVIGLAVFLPALAAYSMAIVAERAPERVRLPNWAYWSATERRAQSIAYLNGHAAWLAALGALLALAVHLLLIRANRHAPPRLDTALFMATLLTFSASLALWIALLHRRFARP